MRLILHDSSRLQTSDLSELIQANAQLAALSNKFFDKILPASPASTLTTKPRSASKRPVSYTHLTLPTILLV